MAASDWHILAIRSRSSFIRSFGDLIRATGPVTQPPPSFKEIRPPSVEASRSLAYRPNTAPYRVSAQLNREECGHRSNETSSMSSVYVNAKGQSSIRSHSSCNSDFVISLIRYPSCVVEVPPHVPHLRCWRVAAQKSKLQVFKISPRTTITIPLVIVTTWQLPLSYWLECQRDGILDRMRKVYQRICFYWLARYRQWWQNSAFMASSNDTRKHDS